MPPKKAPKESKVDHDLFAMSEATQEARLKSLESTVSDLEKKFGEGTIVRLGDAATMLIDVIPTGSITIDIALGVGGIPRGRITEIYGPESSGKTTICLHVVAEAQKRGGLAAFVDMEHALDPRYARALGVDIEKLYISQPDTAEQALEIIEALVRSGALDIIVLDSVAALVPRVEIEGEMGDSHVGVQARLMSQALRKLAGAIKQSNVAVIFTNQLRDKIGVMYGCMPASAPVLLADGTLRAIAEIVEARQPVEVMSYNLVTHVFEPQPVIEWFKQGQPSSDFRLTDAEIAAVDDEYLTIVAEYPNGGFTELTCTPNHTIATPDDFQMADDLEPNDFILVRRAVMPELAFAGGAKAAQNGADITLDVMLDAEVAAVPCRIVDIRSTWITGADALRYNLQVAGNANFMVGDVIVHNSPETTTGGRALKFYASVRLDVRKQEQLKGSSGEVLGSRTRVRVTKNKVAPPFREAEFDIMFLEGGISKNGELLDLGTELNIIEKRGAFFRYNEGLLGQGRENSKVYLEDNRAIRDEIEEQIRAKYGLPSLMGTPAAAPPAPDTTDR
ncbi:MAG: recombinase RecA [Chloroflexota bacterium]|nr:recombinase RecA [Chloroflexota bacterium]